MYPQHSFKLCWGYLRFIAVMLLYLDVLLVYNYMLVKYKFIVLMYKREKLYD